MISRSLLARAFPDNPRLRLELESALDLIDTLTSQADAIQSQLDTVAASIQADTFQPESDTLTAIAALPNDSGAVEMSNGVASLRPIDGSDLASLVSRGALGPYFWSLGNYANDAAAATGGVGVKGLYRNGSTVCVRIA